MKVLHVDSSILGNQSVSRILSRAVVEQLRAINPNVDVVYRDVVATPLGHLFRENIEQDDDQPISFRERSGERKLARRVLEEFMEADVVVLGVAFYNLTISSQLKAWIDRIVIAGKTFRYTARGSEGLMSDKRVILTVARGGYYRRSVFLAPTEHAEAYLRSIFGFMGISEIDVIIAEGLSAGEVRKGDIISAALAEIQEMSGQQKVTPLPTASTCR